METFGFVKVKIATPYTRLVKYYFFNEWDIIGIYYSNNNTLELVLYDFYSSERIRGVNFLGELLVWNAVSEISTTKFYCEEESSIREDIISLLFYRTENVCEVMRKIVLDKTYTSEIDNLLRKKIASFNTRQSNESKYQSTTEGIDCPSLSEKYEYLHETFFSVLGQLSKEGHSVLRNKPRIYSPEKSCCLVRNLYEHIQKRKAGASEPFLVTKDVCDLGDDAFAIPIVINYKGESSERKLELACTGFNVILPSCNVDLSFLDYNTLITILKYVEFCGDSQLSCLERQLVSELAARNM